MTTREPPLITLAGTNDRLELTEANGVVVLAGLQGFNMPPVRLAASTPAGWDGGMVESIRFGIRDVFIPLGLFAASQAEYALLRDRVSQLVSPKTGDVMIEVLPPGGARRSIAGRYVSGFDVPLGQADGLTHEKIGLLFRCVDPLWWAAQATAVTFHPVGAQYALKSFLGDPFFGIRLSGSVEFRGKEWILHNPGFEESYPVIKITGPGTDIVVQNGAQELGLTSLAAGQSITINTRRGVQSVTDENGDSAWERFVPGSTLWPIRPGDNPLLVHYTDGDEHSNIKIDYTPKHLTAW